MRRLQIILILGLFGCGKQSPEAAWEKVSQKTARFHRQGRYAEATAAAQESLKISEERFGDEHQNTARSLEILSVLYSEQGKISEAEPLIVRVLAIQEKTHGKESAEAAGAVKLLGSLYFSQRKYDQAKPLLERALSSSERIHGPESPEVAKDLGNLGSLLIVLGQTAKAEELLKRAVVIWGKDPKPHPLYSTTAMHALAHIHEDQGRHDEADSLYQRILAVREQAYGADHPKVANILKDYVRFLRKTGKAKQAEPVEERLARISGAGTRKVRRIQ